MRVSVTMCPQSLSSSLVASSVFFWTCVPPGGARRFMVSVFFSLCLLSSRWCLALVSFRRWFAQPLWICPGSSTSCRKASRRPLALLALNKENFAEVDYSFNFFLCKVNMIACSVRGDVECRLLHSKTLFPSQFLLTRFVIPGRLISKNKSFSFGYHRIFSGSYLSRTDLGPVLDKYDPKKTTGAFLDLSGCF
jgi:hypothetical protein